MQASFAQHPYERSSDPFHVVIIICRLEDKLCNIFGIAYITFNLWSKPSSRGCVQIPHSSCLGTHCTGQTFRGAHISQEAELGPVLDLDLSSCSGTAMPGKKVPVKEASLDEVRFPGMAYTRCHLGM